MANSSKNRTTSESYQNLTGAASKGFTSATYQRTEPAPTFEKFRSIARATRRTWIEEKKRIDAEIKSVSDTYLAGVAVPKITELRNDYNNRRFEAVLKLKKSLKGICEAKRSALDEYMMRAPKSDVLNLLTAYNMRQGTINPRELQALLTRCGSNYQSLQIARDITERNGYSFKMPIDLDEYLSDLDVIQETLGKLIDEYIDKEDTQFSYNGAVFFGYEDDECMLKVKNLGYNLSENDTITESLTGVVPTVADSMQAVIELKKVEVETARENGDIHAARSAAQELNTVANYFNKNKNDLMDESERKEAARKEAAEVLDGVMD